MPISAEGRAMLNELAGLLNTANADKQAGFYSDFDPESGSWSSPNSATGAEFTKILALIGE
jgi:hypothetical protein